MYKKEEKLKCQKKNIKRIHQRDKKKKLCKGFMSKKIKKKTSSAFHPPPDGPWDWQLLSPHLIWLKLMVLVPWRPSTGRPPFATRTTGGSSGKLDRSQEAGRTFETRRVLHRAPCFCEMLEIAGLAGFFTTNMD